MGIALRVVSYRAGVLQAVVTYDVAGIPYDHAFTTHRVTEVELGRTLAAAGLRLDGWLTDDHRWLRAAPERVATRPGLKAPVRPSR